MIMTHSSSSSSSREMALSNSPAFVDPVAELVAAGSSHQLNHPPITSYASSHATAISTAISAAMANTKATPTATASKYSKAPPVRKARPAKIRVRFACAADKITNRHKVVRREDFPLAWYQPQDYVHIKLGILASIQAIGSVFSSDSNGNSDTSSDDTDTDGTPVPAAAAAADTMTPALDLSEHCLRGIETGISSELYQRRKIRIHTTTQSVLEQQQIFRMLGVASDPHALRAVSLQCSHSALESAQAVAQLDAAAKQA